MSKGFDRPLQHHEYIKLKYLTGTCDQLEEKAKKRKLIKAATKCKKIRIYDDDIDLKKLQPNRADSDDEEIHYGTKEDRPVIAAIIDERPKSRKAQGKWVSVETPDLSRVKVEREDGDDGDVNKTQDLQLTSDQNSAKSSSPRRGRRSRWEEPDDLSPPRRATSQPSNTDTNDLSPPRQRNTSTRDDLSPPRNSNSREADLSPPRARHSGSNKDLSPPRRRREDKRDHRDRYRSNHSTKHEVVIKKEKESPERGREQKSSERHRDTRHEQRTSSDLSPPRKSHRGSRSERIDSNRVIDSRPTKSSHRDSDSHRSSKRSEDTHVSSRHHTDSHRSDSDKGRPMVSADKEQNEVVTEKRHGLSSAKAIKEEEMRLRAKEKEAFSKIDATLLGKGAKTVHRDSKTGKIRDMDAEAKESAEKREAEDAKYAKYKDWNVGLKQREEQKQNLEDALHEMSKPLARYEDDADLDKLLREKEQADDPMLAYFRKKKRKEKIKEAKEKGVPVEPEKPRYKGPTAAPLNRFNIEPGYRWDGVDRSNGFEKSYFEKIAEKTAIQEEAYRWSTEDM